jgi:hypothetical protein
VPAQLGGFGAGGGKVSLGGPARTPWRRMNSLLHTFELSASAAERSAET